MTITNSKQKPARPFGVTLALITSFVMFVALPVIEMAFVISVNNMMTFDTVGRSGINVIGIERFGSQMILQSALALGFCILIVMAWFGRPSNIRFIFSAAVASLGLLTVVSQILPRLMTSSTVLDSTRDINQSVLLFYLVMTILITLYSVWYMNRWAARAFYRGYYLPEDIEEMNRIEQELRSSADKIQQTSTV